MLVVLFLLVLPQSKASAAEASSPPPVTGTAAPLHPVQVRVGIVLVDIGRLDTSTGTYQVDFYMSFRCDEACDPTTFELMNGRATLVDQQDDKPSYKEFRVQATLSHPLELQRYPFDTHELTIVMEDKLKGNTRLVYVPDEEHTYTEVRSINGWQLAPGYRVGVDNHYYKIFDEEFSRFTFGVRIYRPLLAGILKGLVPPIFLTWMGFLSVLMGTEQYRERLGVTTGTLTGTLIFHVSMTAAIPPVAYLTFADIFMIASYSCLFLTYVSTVIQMWLSNTGRLRWIRAVRTASGIAIPAMWIAAQIGNIVHL